MSEGKIQHKINPVADELCEMCLQYWEGGCRAYQQPHTREEREHRETGRALCESDVFRAGYAEK